MKNLVAILMLAGMLGYTGVNFSKTSKKAHAYNMPNIGDWDYYSDFCKDPGDGCIHLDPVVLK